MSSKLYELTANYNKLWELVDGDMDMEVIEDTLQAIEDAIEVKVENIVKFLQSMDADAKAIKAEEKRLSERRKALENKQASIKEYVQVQMELAGLDKVKTATHTVAIQNNPPAVNITSPEVIPALYMTIIPQQLVPNKKAIKEAIQAGDIIPGAELVQGRSLRVR